MKRNPGLRGKIAMDDAFVIHIPTAIEASELCTYLYRKTVMETNTTASRVYNLPIIANWMAYKTRGRPGHLIIGLPGLPTLLGPASRSRAENLPPSLLDNPPSVPLIRCDWFKARLSYSVLRSPNEEGEKDPRVAHWTETKLSRQEVMVIDYHRTERGRRIVQPLGEIERFSVLESGRRRKSRGAGRTLWKRRETGN